MASGATRANENIPTLHHRVQTTVEEQSIGSSIFQALQCEGPVHAAGAVQPARSNAGIGRGVARHRLGRRAPGAEHHDGREPVGTGSDRRTHTGRHEPQAHEWRVRWQYPVRLPAMRRWQALGARPAEQAVLARLRTLRSSHSLRKTAAQLNADGFRTRRGTAWRLESGARVVKQDLRMAA
jgi:hypothetical protein